MSIKNVVFSRVTERMVCANPFETRGLGAIFSNTHCRGRQAMIGLCFHNVPKISRIYTFHSFSPFDNPTQWGLRTPKYEILLKLLFALSEEYVNL